MDQLINYIQQARSQGQSDLQIRQSLLGAGWNPEQVNAAITRQNPTTVNAAQPNTVPGPNIINPAPVTNNQAFASSTQAVTAKRPKSKLKLHLVLSSLIVLIIIIGAIAFLVIGHKTSYQTVINQFITAMQNKDKQEADSLESPAFKAEGQKYVGNASFYSSCQKLGQFCTPYFTSAFLNKASKTYKDYTAVDGTKGKEVIYTLKQSISGNKAGGQGCSSTSVSTVGIAVIPKGSTWQIDDAYPSFSASANLCSGAQTESGNLNN